MSEIPNIESLSHGDFRCQILDRLKLLLHHLPRQLPIRAADSAFSSFLFFRIDPDLLEKTGCEVSALSEQLKRILDMISETEVTKVSTDKGTSTRGPSKPANPERKISVSEAFDNW